MFHSFMYTIEKNPLPELVFTDKTYFVKSNTVYYTVDFRDYIFKRVDILFFCLVLIVQNKSIVFIRLSRIFLNSYTN
jgi:hypothetical protein